MKLLDTILISTAQILLSACYIPQVIRTVQTHHVADFSLPFVITVFLGCFLSMIYFVRRKDWIPAVGLSISSAFWLFMLVTHLLWVRG
jgi:uncharacterized protein with PQ loop repeat